jgi:DNA polymerase-1
LAARLGITRGEAANYIELYFKQYPGIRAYMDSTIAFAREHGYVKTLMGRRIYVKDILSKQANLRAFSERAAINAPLQGSAADIIKCAMVTVERSLNAEFPDAKLLLQVHDELLIEAPAQIVETVSARVVTLMQQAAYLSIPLTVEAGIGDNWGNAH